MYKVVNLADSRTANINDDNPGLTEAHLKNAQAINNLGQTVNSIGKVAISIKKINYARLTELQKQKVKFKPEYTKPKNRLVDFARKITEFKIPSFMDNLLGLLGNLLKLLLLPVLKWLADPENQKKIESVLKTLHGIFKGIMAIAKFSTNNILDGLYDMLRDDASWWERLVGFGKFLVGAGTALLAFRWLNPLAIGRTLRDMKWILTTFKVGLKGAYTKLLALKMGKLAWMFGIAGVVATGAVLATATPVADGTLDAHMDADGNLPGDPNYQQPEQKESWLSGIANTIGGWFGGGDKKQEQQQPPKQEEKKSGIWGGIQNFLGGFGKKKEQPKPKQEQKQDKKWWQFWKEAGGMVPALQQAAAGGWISGPQSGYPVSLDGKNTSFIGHGTEYVARDAGGRAFVIPFDTKSTRKDPGLTSKRIGEAARLGFKTSFMDGGLYDFAKQMIMIHEGSNKVGGKHVQYRDSQGNPTIGYGHLVKPGSNFGGSISQDQADKLFNKDFRKHSEAAKRIPGWDKATPQQKAGLIDLTFNMGDGWWMQFPKFSDAMAKGDYEKAAKELRSSHWYAQTGRRGPTIIDLIKNQGVNKSGYLADLNVPKSGIDDIDGLSNFLRGRAGSNKQKLEGALGRATHPDTGSGWGISGQLDSSGRPVVLSEPGARAFLQMMGDSSGSVRGSDVTSSGRSRKKNKSISGAHPNSHHLYGEGLDVSGSTAVWMRKYGAKYGWKFVYSYGNGGAHFKYVGPGAGQTPILGKPGSDATKGKTGGGPLGSIVPFTHNRNTANSFGDGSRGGGGSGMNASPGGSGSQRLGGGRRRGGIGNVQKNMEESKVKSQTEQRNQARREITARSQQMVADEIAAVNSSNSSTASIISRAFDAVRSAQGASSGGSIMVSGGGGGGGGGGSSSFGGFARTAVSVLNSFNNPLRGMFRL